MYFLALGMSHLRPHDGVSPEDTLKNAHAIGGIYTSVSAADAYLTDHCNDLWKNGASILDCETLCVIVGPRDVHHEEVAGNRFMEGIYQFDLGGALNMFRVYRRDSEGSTKVWLDEDGIWISREYDAAKFLVPEHAAAFAEKNGISDYLILDFNDKLHAPILKEIPMAKPTIEADTPFETLRDETKYANVIPLKNNLFLFIDYSGSPNTEIEEAEEFDTFGDAVLNRPHYESLTGAVETIEVRRLVQVRLVK